MNDYLSFLASKTRLVEPSGFDRPGEWPHLCPFQRDLVRWALRQGRCALFADTGLGKSRMQLTWSYEIARETKGEVLILAPLAVAAQTVREGASVGIEVALCRDASDVKWGINITNYDRLHRFDPARFAAIVLDESSCIKHENAKTLARLIAAFGDTKYRLCATATPAPNDFSELGTHAEFLGVCTRQEMLSEFFVHDAGDTGEWRLKGHARAEFWRWVSSWGALIRKPSDLGYPDDGYNLPPLTVQHHHAPTDQAILRQMGVLFADQARDLVERRNARKASAQKRVAMVAEMVNASKEQWFVLGDLNVETQGVRRLVPDAVEVAGPDTPEHKEESLLAFADGAIRVLVSKGSIAGWGLNLQRCHNIAFIGVSDSWESYYQSVRRCYRFGQTSPVNVHIFASEAEGAVTDNLKRKEQDAQKMADELSAMTRDALRANVTRRTQRHHAYQPAASMPIPGWLRSANG